MKYLKKYKLFESVKSVDDYFDNVRLNINRLYLEKLIKDEHKLELTKLNDNFYPDTIKDFLIDLIDQEIIINMEINKYYLIIGGNNTEIFLKYKIEVDIELNSDATDNHVNRKKYLDERDRLLEILSYHYDHNNLNKKLLNYDESEVGTRYIPAIERLSKFALHVTHNSDYKYVKNKDQFDLWSGKFLKISI
jgi:hypothetical protein